jgi:hypothetical protein
MPVTWKSTPSGNVRYAIKCVCGLVRCLPDAEVGDVVTLVPCPKCGTPFRGRCGEAGVEELQ